MFCACCFVMSYIDLSILKVLLHSLCSCFCTFRLSLIFFISYFFDWESCDLEVHALAWTIFNEMLNKVT